MHRQRNRNEIAQQLREQKPGHASISVRERVDKQKLAQEQHRSANAIHITHAARLNLAVVKIYQFSQPWLDLTRVRVDNRTTNSTDEIFSKTPAAFAQIVVHEI